MTLFAAPWTIAPRPLSLWNFPGKNASSGLPFLSPRGNWGIEKNYLTQVNIASNSRECYLNSGYQAALLLKKSLLDFVDLVEGWSGCSSPSHSSWLWCLLFAIYIRKSFYLCLVSDSLLRILFFPSCFLDPVSSSSLALPSNLGGGEHPSVYPWKWMHDKRTLWSFAYVWECHINVFM